jgi:phosphate transport system permease protein
MAALLFAAAMLLTLLVTIIRPGISGFFHHEVRVEIDTAPIAAQLQQNPATLDYYALAHTALTTTAHGAWNDAAERHALYALAGSFVAFDLRQALMQQRAQWGQTLTLWLPLADNADMFLKGKIDRQLPLAQRALNDQQIAWIDAWLADGRIRKRFSSGFFTHGDSREPDAAGFGGSLVG